MTRKLMLFLLMLILTISGRALAQTDAFAVYNMGTPRLTPIYISPTGDDNNDGGAPERALRTVEAAWQRIPTATAGDIRTGGCAGFYGVALRHLSASGDF